MQVVAVAEHTVVAVAQVAQVAVAQVDGVVVVMISALLARPIKVAVVVVVRYTGVVERVAQVV
jgi:hypothetical protein